MTPEQRTELRRLAEAATPGKWTDSGSWCGSVFSDASPGAVGVEMRPCDSAYIAAANPKAIIDLLDALDRETK